MNLVHLVCIETSHFDTWKVFVLELFGLPPVEDSLVLGVIDIHQRCKSFVLVGREQAVDVSELYHRANDLVFFNRFLAECLLIVGHVLRLNLHAETSAHGDVDTHLQTCGAIDGMVRSGRDMTCHRDGREEVARAPLHVDAL